MPVEIKQLMVKGVMEDTKESSGQSSSPSMAKEESGNLTYSAKKQIIDECVREVMERIKKLNEL
jgi:hypothetical protein